MASFSNRELRDAMRDMSLMEPSGLKETVGDKLESAKESLAKASAGFKAQLAEAKLGEKGANALRSASTVSASAAAVASAQMHRLKVCLRYMKPHPRHHSHLRRALLTTPYPSWTLVNSQWIALLGICLNVERLEEPLTCGVVATPLVPLPKCGVSPRMQTEDGRYPDPIKLVLDPVSAPSEGKNEHGGAPEAARTRPGGVRYQQTPR
jgi:hypothetical protein